MNFISFFIIKAKLEIIAKLKFSLDIQQLKTFLKIIEYFQKFILRYNRVAKLLQDLKTSLLKNVTIKKQKQKYYFL